MTSDRCYRPALTPDEAKRRLLAESGTQFDPEGVAAFVALELDPGAVEDVLEPVPDLPTAAADSDRPASLAA